MTHILISFLTTRQLSDKLNHGNFVYTQSIAFEWVCETTDVKGQVQKYPVVSQNKSYITLQFGSCSHPFFASSRVS